MALNATSSKMALSPRPSIISHSRFLRSFFALVAIMLVSYFSVPWHINAFIPANLSSVLISSPTPSPFSSEIPPICLSIFKKSAYTQDLPQCRMPSIFMNAVDLDETQRYFVPPSLDASNPALHESFLPFNDTYWINSFCRGNKILVPDRLHFYLQDRAEWETESIVEQIAPFVFDSIAESPAVQAVHYHSRYVFTFHLAYDGKMLRIPRIVSEFAETIDCLRQHLSLWYDQNTVNGLFLKSNATLMVGESASEELPPALISRKLHQMLATVDSLRIGALVMNNTEINGQDDHYILMSSNPGVPPLVSAEYPEPLAPIKHTLKFSRFVLPEVVTIFGVSDEFIFNEAIAEYSARWRSLDPSGRVYMRQYAPRIMRNETRGNILANHIDHVMSGFRYYGRDRLSFEASYSKNILHRKYLWSFLGDLKSDRRHMNHTLTSWFIRSKLNEKFAYFCCGGTTAVRHYYSQSIFVPIGRGNANLDCFRIYEAAGLGAIPVIVSPDRQEIYHTFGYFAIDKFKTPPFVFANSWDLATQEMQRLLQNPFELQRIHHDVTRWFFENLSFVRRKIYSRLPRT